MADEMARLRAFAAEAVAWPAGEGVDVRLGVMGGDPCFAGTRIWLWLLFNSAWDDATLLEQYPSLTPEALAHGHAYVDAHRALFAGEQYRATMRDADPEDVAALVADVRALLAALADAEQRAARDAARLAALAAWDAAQARAIAASTAYASNQTDHDIRQEMIVAGRLEQRARAELLRVQRADAARPGVGEV